MVSIPPIYGDLGDGLLLYPHYRQYNPQTNHQLLSYWITIIPRYPQSLKGSIIPELIINHHLSVISTYVSHSLMVKTVKTPIKWRYSSTRGESQPRYSYENSGIPKHPDVAASLESPPRFNFIRCLEAVWILDKGSRFYLWKMGF